MSSKAALDEAARLEREEKAAKAASAALSLKEKIARNKAEAERKRKEKADAAAKKKEEEEIKLREKKDRLRASVSRGKRLSQAKLESTQLQKEMAKMAAEEEKAKQKAESLALINRVKEEAAAKKAEAEAAKKAEEEAAAEAQRKAAEERRRKREEELAVLREEQKKAEEEEKRKKEEELARLEEERKEKQRKRLEELARQKAEQEAREAEERAEAEAKLKAMEEENRLAMQRHAEEVRKQQEAERDMEEEERKRLEAERAAAFEEEQARRQKEVEAMMAEEEERRKRNEQKMKELGLSDKVVNRVGLFSNFGEEPGLEIWVLGDQQISKIAKLKHGLRGLIGECHGTFHTGKAYVILHTAVSGGRSHYHIHTWIGNDCPDEMRAQCDKRMAELELGLALEDVVAITHETQEKEREHFRAYFDKPIEYVQAVQLRKTEGPNFLDKVLYQIKGRNCVRVRRVDAVPESLNSGDVFVLEDSHAIFQWNGVKSNKMERGKALDFGVQRRIERNARVRVIIVDEGKGEFENKKFWAALTLDRSANGEFVVPGGAEGEEKAVGATPDVDIPTLKSQEEGGDDIEYEKAYLAAHKLHRVAHAEGDADVAVSEVEVDGTRGPDISALDERHCFVLDAETEIFHWVGNLSTEEARKAAEELANKLAAEACRPACTAVTRVRQQTEPYLFKEKFTGNWGEYADFDFSERVTGNVANLEQKEVNIDEMHHPEKYAIAREDERLPVPNYDPKIESDFSVWVVDSNDKYEVPAEQRGVFHSANCYILMYTMQLGVDHAGNDKTRHILYFWQGRHSSREDRGLSALLASEDAKKLRFCQVRRVVQNKEPEHFLSHFADRGMVVCLGSRHEAAAELSEGKLLSSGTHLYQARGECAITAHAVEADAVSAASLNSRDSFLLAADDQCFVWRGSRANDHSAAAAARLAAMHGGKVTEVAEGSEPAAFWTALGGEGEYCRDAVTTEPAASLFSCSNTIGIFRVHRLEDWAQEDLHSRDCAILDATNRVFVWVGGDSNEECAKMALETAENFVAFESDETKPRADCPVVPVEAGAEPAAFRAMFHTWDTLLAEAGKDGYNAALRALQKAQKD